MRLEKMRTLLGRERIDGSPAELEVLGTRLDDLVRMNGEDWVRANRERLLREWDTILRLKLIR